MRYLKLFKGLLDLELTSRGMVSDKVKKNYYWEASIEEYLTLKAIEQYAGSFVKSLGEAYIRADQNNKLKLINAFTEYFDEYKEVAKASKKDRDGQ